MNTLPIESSQPLVAANKSTMTTLISAAKASPVKTGLVVAGTLGIIAGSVYGVRKYRAYKAEKSMNAAVQEVAEVAAAEAAAAEAAAAEAAAKPVNNKTRNEKAKA